MRSRLVVTGASGLLGSNLVYLAKDAYQVVAITHRHRMQYRGVKVIQCDLSQPGAAFKIIHEIRPAAIIHAAAETNIDRCEQNEARAYLLNRDMAGEVARAARAIEAYFIHISTDAVFEGRQDLHSETDQLAPVNIYGRSKAAGEALVQKLCSEVAIVRTNFYGWNMLDKMSLSEWFLDHLEKGRSCNGFEDVWTTPLLVNDLVSCLLRMVENKPSGVFHVGGADCVSKFHFGRSIAAVAELDLELIRPGTVDEAGLIAPRPRKLCLDSSKIFHAVKFEAPSLYTGIGRFLELRSGGYVESLKAMNV